MQSEKRVTLEYYFLSSNKKAPNDEQETEPNIAISSTLSTAEIQDLACSSSLHSNQPSTDCVSCNDAPVQKKLATYPANQQNRSFQSTWFNDRIWLEYSVLNDASYCYYCRHFPSNQLNADDSFTTVGFNSWKKALDKGSGFIKHASSQAHIIATKNYLTYKQQQGANSNVLKQLDSCRAIQIRRNRDSMTKICSTLRFLARQMIGFRGHEENEKSSNQGNFLEILRWASETDPLIKSIFEDSTGNASYLSHDIQNELIHIMSNEIREEISFMLNNNKYALMADECRDISGTQQLSIVIRFVPNSNNSTTDKKHVVKEYFLGFIPLEKFDATTLANNIVEFLNHWKIPLESCICLCFDGASVMSGCAAGVHVLLKKYMPKGIYINCAVHRLNLAINDTSKAVCYMSDYFSIASQLYSFFTESAVTNIYFNKAQIDLGLVQSSTLKLWAITRWDSRWTAINAVVNNFPAILKALSDISEDGNGSRATNAGGLLMHDQKSIFIVTSFILHKFLGIIKVLRDHLKSSSFDYVRGECLITSVIQQLKDLRNDESFNQIYEKVKEFCNSNDIDFVQQYRSYRTTAVPARFQEFIIDSTIGQRETLQTSTDYLNRLYFPLIDCMLVELNDRFSSKTLSLMKSISTVYPSSTSFLNTDAIDEFCCHIGGDSSALKNEFFEDAQ
ncbi:unnamed protein product [Rotaria magnacalcarata]|uniref:TTF-type domain-containing protein n=1 Tax=Rotaria magnacalcarata TaxID=392030 RepID=A0A8S2MU38_9BILA|nr:unnamed protein product [Rotaria magnacalcarata]